MSSSRASDRVARLVASLLLLLAPSPGWAQPSDLQALFGGWIDLDGDARNTREELVENPCQTGVDW